MHIRIPRQIRCIEHRLPIRRKARAPAVLSSARAGRHKRLRPVAENQRLVQAVKVCANAKDLLALDVERECAGCRRVLEGRLRTQSNNPLVNRL
jgi:hypothetical protein